MLNLKQLAALFLICLIAFIPYFLTPTIGGFDSYYYLNALSIPQSAFLWVKVAVFLSMFASVVFIAWLGQAINPKYWTAGIFVFASPIFLMEFLKFENDQFAYPFLFLSLALFFRNKKIEALIALVPAFILWQGSALYIIAYSLTWLPLLLPAIPLAFYIAVARTGNFMPNLAVQENFPMIGILYHMFALAGIYYLPKKMAKPFIFLFLLAFLNAKYSIHIVPFLAVGLAIMFEKEKNMTLKSLVIAGTVMSLVFMAMLIQVYPPVPQQVEAVQFAVEEADSSLVYNDWSWGHVIEYYGGEPLARSGGAQPDLNCTNCVVLSSRDINCSCINGCEYPLTVFKC